ncbi:MAG: phosphatidylglycerophosphatase A [Clostridia bacterium]|nr:phosphatidylglycerophosphatase A [Clostridia bacterium]
MESFIKILATGFGSGYLKPAPGTWGTLTGLIIACFWRIDLMWIFILSLIGIIICHLGEKILKEHDSPKIVFDEMVGIWISVWNIPLLLYPVAFLLFRFFDIFKFSPIDELQKVPGGLGIMLDDIMAGIISRILLGIIMLIFF